MENHLGDGDRLFIVPDLLVQEPVPWGDIPRVIRLTHSHVVKATAPKNDCGECRACCTTLYINEDGFKKPSQCECEWSDKEVGCLIYFNQPNPCRAFECLWLKSQSNNDRMIPELRPDRCGVIFTHDTVNGERDLIEAHPSANSLDNSHVRQFITEQEKFGNRVKIVTHYIGEDK